MKKSVFIRYFIINTICLILFPQIAFILPVNTMGFVSACVWSVSLVTYTRIFFHFSRQTTSSWGCFLFDFEYNGVCEYLHFSPFCLLLTITIFLHPNVYYKATSSGVAFYFILNIMIAVETIATSLYGYLC